MTLLRLHARVCPCCGRDVANIHPAPGGHRVICDPELGGCGSEGQAGPSEALALSAWNGSQTPGARALMDAAAKRWGVMA